MDADVSTEIQISRVLKGDVELAVLFVFDLSYIYFALGTHQTHHKVLYLSAIYTPFTDYITLLCVSICGRAYVLQRIQPLTLNCVFPVFFNILCHRLLHFVLLQSR